MGANVLHQRHLLDTGRAVRGDGSDRVAQVYAQVQKPARHERAAGLGKVQKGMRDAATRRA